MRPRFVWIVPLFRRPRRLLLVLAIVVLLGVALAPFLWAAFHRYVGERELNRYHSAEARSHLHQCMRIWPWSRNAHVHLLAARAARREGDFEEAALQLHQCRNELGDRSAESFLEWAMLRAAVGDMDAVEEFLKSSGRDDPRSASLILESLAVGYLRMSRIVDALNCIDEWLAREPNNAQAWYQRGNIHRQVGAAQESATDYRRVLELDPERGKARWWLALALLEIGRYDEALEYLEMVRRVQPDDIEVRVRLAVCHNRLGQDRRAEELLDGVLTEHPDHALALRTRGWIDLNADRLPEAERWLRRAAKVWPNDYKTQFWLAMCLRKQHKTEEAEIEEERARTIQDRRQRQSEILTHLMSQKPHDADLQCELGNLYLQLGNPKIGEGWLLNAVHLDERHAPALQALADYYKKRGDLDKAEEYHRRARNPSH
jgi:tetratricopeptide (TPR) repeat protein